MGKNVKEVLDDLFDDHEIVKVGELQRATGLTRQGLHHHLRRLLDAGVIVRRGRGRGAHYLRAAGAGAASGPLIAGEPSRSDSGGDGEALTLHRALSGLEEHRVWRDLLATPPLGGLSEAAVDVLGYAVTEMVNNAIEHSGGDTLELSAARAGDTLCLTIRDDGVGAFAHLRAQLGLADELEALQEVSKGKVTTDPEHHTGEGLFFTSRAVDLFELRSGALRWIVDNLRDESAVGEGPSRSGTEVELRMRPDAPRDLAALFAAHTRDLDFVRTRTVVKLFEKGVRFVSRSEARRLARGLERFGEIVVDFKGVHQVGQGFCDELFRVWAHAHPGHRLEPVNMNGAIAALVERSQRTPWGPPR